MLAWLLSLSISFLPLGPDAFAVAVSRDRVGTFLVFAHGEMVWNMWQVGVENFGKNELGRWAYRDPGFHDGPLTAELYALPKTRAGHPRFLVAGTAHPALGGDWPVQISVWEWDGRALQRRFMKVARQSMSFDWSLRVEGARVLVHTREPLKSLHACGMCGELESIWTLEVGDEVRDLGRRPITVELAAVDDLIDAARRGAPVVRGLRDKLPQGSLGLFQWTLHDRVLHLQADEAQLDFVFARDQPRVIAVHGRQPRRL